MKLNNIKRKSRIAITSQFFLMGLLFSTIVSRFPALKEFYGLSLSELSFIPFAMSAGALVSMPLCVHLSGQYGSRKVGWFGLAQALWISAYVLMPNIVGLYLAAAIYGALMQLADIAMNGNSILVEKAYKRPILGFFHSSFYFGVALGGAISIATMLTGFSVRLHFILTAIIGAIWFLLNHRFYLQETPQKTNKTGKKRFSIVLPEGILLLIAFVAFCGRIVEGSISDWSTVYMKNMINLEEVFSPVGLIVYALFISFGRLFSDIIRKRYKEIDIIIGCGVVTGLGLLIMISSLNAYLAVCGLLISGLGLSCFVPIIYSLAGNQKGVNPGMGIAMVNTVSGTGFLFGPSVIGLIAEHYNLRVSFIYVLIVTLILITLACKVKKRESEDQY